MNYIERWAARDESERTRQIIFIGEKEPFWQIDRWIWNPGQQFISVGPNDTDVNLLPGQKCRVRIKIEKIEE